ncbi:scaffold attachment factor B1 isoform X3 [Paramormyrops kingsleyae]|uniref:scaffold attachment factor B1 isoform X3 n=1 Tax=Paramormyrops kingsleyae TaxID=1676925 RepID=UPI003B96D7A0
MAESSSASDAVSLELPEGAGLHKLSELRVIDLKAKLKRRILYKTVLSKRLKKEDPDINLDSNLDSLHEMDIMDMSVLDETGTDNGIPAECDDSDADEILDSLSNEGNAEVAQDEHDIIHDEDSGFPDPLADVQPEEIMDPEGVDLGVEDEDLKYSAKEDLEQFESEDVKDEIENEKVAGSCKSEPLKEEPLEQPSEEEPTAIEGSLNDEPEEDNVSVAINADDAFNLESEASASDMEKGESKESEGKSKAEDKHNVQEDVMDTDNVCTQASSLSEQGLNEKCAVESEAKSKAVGEEDGRKTEESAAESTAVKEFSSLEADDQKKSTDEEKGSKPESKDGEENEKVAGSCKSEPLKEEPLEQPSEEEPTAIEGSLNDEPEEDNVSVAINADDAFNLESEASASDMEKGESKESEGKSKAEDKHNVQEDVMDTDNACTQASSLSEQGSNEKCAVESEAKSKAVGEEDGRKTEESAAESTAVKEFSSLEADDQKKSTDEEKGSKPESKDGEENEKVAGSCKSEPLKEEPLEQPSEEEPTAIEGSLNDEPEEDNVSVGINADDAFNLESEASASDMEKGESKESEGKSKAEDKHNVQEDVMDTDNACTQASSLSKQGLNEKCAVKSEAKSKAVGEEDGRKTEESAAESTAVKESSSLEADDQKKSTDEEKGSKPESKDGEENEKVAGSCKSEPLKEEPLEQPSEEEPTAIEGSLNDEPEEDNVSVAINADDAFNLESEASASDMEKGESKESEGKSKAEDKHNVQEDVMDMDNACTQASSLSEQGSNEKCAVESEAKSKAVGEEDGRKTEESAAESTAVKESSSLEGDDQKKSTDEEKGSKPESKDGEAPASAQAATSSGRNLWVSGLSSTTRATDLKNLFSKYGKVVGAKVVTNARSPGARCYGFVTMCSTEEATKCIDHLHRTELHGRMISVERAKNEPAGKKPADKTDAKKSGSDRRHSSDSKPEKSDASKDEKSEGPEAGKDAKGRGAERTVVMDKSKGEPVISVKTKSKERSTKSRDRRSPSKEKKDILSFDQIKEQRERERQRQREREIREVERRRHSGERERDRDGRAERERIRLFREREERERLMRKRNWLEVEKQRLDADRMEREFLERERMRVEYERRREQERIHREREELRRQQEQLRFEQDRRPLKRPYDMDRKDDWQDKRLAMDDRYGRSDFGRPDRYQDFDHRDRGRYHDDILMDRRDTSRGMMGDRDGHFDRNDRHGRDSRDSWGYDKRGLNPRDGRDWDSGRKIDGDRGWQSERGMPGQSHMGRGGMSGRGGYMQGTASQNLSGALNRPNQMMQSSGIQGAAFGRRY